MLTLIEWQPIEGQCPLWPEHNFHYVNNVCNFTNPLNKENALKKGEKVIQVINHTKVNFIAVMLNICPPPQI